MSKPTSFVPAFNPTVTISYAQYAFPINSVYCLMPDSASILAAILADLKPQIIYKDPQLDFRKFHYSQVVPWLVFPDGTLCNAGQLADYWRQRPDDSKVLVSPDFGVAERDCRLDIAAAMELTKQFGFNIEV